MWYLFGFCSDFRLFCALDVDEFEVNNEETDEEEPLVSHHFIGSLVIILLFFCHMARFLFAYLITWQNFKILSTNLEGF